jgi:hypothetical protein
MGKQAIHQDREHSRLLGGVQSAIHRGPKPILSVQGENSIVTQTDFNKVLELLAKWLPVPFKLDPSN